MWWVSIYVGRGEVISAYLFVSCVVEYYVVLAVEKFSLCSSL